MYKRPLPGGPVPRGQFPFLVDQAHFQLALVACFPHDLPALVVTTFVLGHVLGERVHRPVVRRVGDVHEERVVPLVLGDDAGGMVVNRIGVIECLGLLLWVGVGRNQGVVPGQ